MKNIRPTTTIKELFYANKISVRTFHCCTYAEIYTLNELINYRKVHEFTRLRNCGKKTCKELEMICSLLNDSMIQYDAQDNEELLAITEDKPFISKVKDDFFAAEFERLKKSLSVRARNICKSTYQHYSQIIPYFNVCEKEYKNYFTTKRKSADELFTFLIAFKNVYEQYKSVDDKEIIRLKEEEQYPFLLKIELDFVNEKAITLGRLPMFYIIEKYISLTPDRETSIYSQHFGISGSTPLSLDEIAILNHSSRERVRQIISNFQLPLNLVSKKDSRWIPYSNILPLVITDNSIFFKKIVEEESLNNSFISFAGLVISVFHYSKVRFHNRIFLVPNKYKTEARRAIKETYNLFQTRFSVDSSFTISSAFQIKATEKIRLYKEIIEAMYPVNISPDNKFTIKQSKVLIEDEIIAVLKLFGEPMSIDDLFLLFKDKYPEHKFTDAKSLRPYFSKSTRIVALGKSGLYGLSEWKLFTGSIRDFAYQVLMESPVPIPDEELSSIILVHFPSSNKRSIISSLMSDRKGRFVHFRNFSTGLASRQYPKEYIVCPSIIPFEDRLSDLREFITKFKRYPFISGGDEEASLYRWIKNHTKPGIMYNKTQAEQINKILKEYSQYPHTEIEYKFFNHCISYKHFIMKTFRLPDQNSEDPKEQELAKWFFNSTMRIQTYEDNRSLYFEDVLHFMNDYGYYVS